MAEKKKEENKPGPAPYPYSNITPPRPLSDWPNVNPDVNQRVEWEGGKPGEVKPSRPVKKEEILPGHPR